MLQVIDLCDELSKKMETAECEDFIEIKCHGTKCVMARKYLDGYWGRIKNFEVFEDDVWVVSYPKCGMTWTQEMVWLLNHDLDYQAALKTKLIFRFPCIEYGGLSSSTTTNTIERCTNLPRPRHIKTHLPVFMLPEQLWTVKPKIIYITRNPRDAAVSYFHHYRNVNGYTGSKADFFEAFLQDKTVYSPFDSHVIDFWKLARQSPNVLFLFYENLQKDLDHEVKRVMKFLKREFPQDQIDELCRHLSFESMKRNASCNWEPNTHEAAINGQQVEKFEFIRQGKIGSHRQEMSESQRKKFNRYVERFSGITELAAAFS